MMDCKRCQVAHGAQGWTAQTETGETGPYVTQDMAMRVALSEVLRLRRAGHAARLALRNARGDLRDICLCAMVNGPTLMDGERRMQCPFLADVIDIADV